LLLVSSSVAVALAVLTRYAGLALIVSGVLGIFLFDKRAPSRKFRTAAIFCVISCILIAGWAIRNLTVAGTATNRSLVFHPIGLREAQQAFGTLSEWLLLDRFQAWIVLPIMGAAVLASGSLLLIVSRSLPSKKSIKAHILGIPIFPRLLLV